MSSRSVISGINSLAGAAGASLVNPYNLDALIRGLIYVGSGVLRDASSSLFSGGAAVSHVKGGRRRRAEEAAAAAASAGDRQFNFQAQVSAAEAELRKLQTEFEDQKKKWAKDDLPLNIIQSIRHEYENKAAGVREKIKTLRESDAVQRAKTRKTKNAANISSTDYRRFARDYRRRGRLMRYTRQSGRSRFIGRYKKGFRKRYYG